MGWKIKLTQEKVHRLNFVNVKILLEEKSGETEKAILLEEKLKKTRSKGKSTE